MRRITHQHARYAVEDPTRTLFSVIERVAFAGSTCGRLTRTGARVYRCGQPTHATPAFVGDIIMGSLGAQHDGAHANTGR